MFRGRTAKNCSWLPFNLTWYYQKATQL